MKDMTREEAHAALAGVHKAMHAQHNDERGRLTQLATAIATARMAVDRLFSDAEDSAAEATANEKG